MLRLVMRGEVANGCVEIFLLSWIRMRASLEISKYIEVSIPELLCSRSVLLLLMLRSRFSVEVNFPPLPPLFLPSMNIEYFSYPKASRGEKVQSIMYHSAFSLRRMCWHCKFEFPFGVVGCIAELRWLQCWRMRQEVHCFPFPREYLYERKSKKKGRRFFQAKAAVLRIVSRGSYCSYLGIPSLNRRIYAKLFLVSSSFFFLIIRHNMEVNIRAQPPTIRARLSRVCERI